MLINHVLEPEGRRPENSALRQAHAAADDAGNYATEHLIDRMRCAFDDALVTGWEPLYESFGLTDTDDEHVVAAGLDRWRRSDRDRHRQPGALHRRQTARTHRLQTARDFAANTVSADDRGHATGGGELPPGPRRVFRITIDRDS